MISKNFFPQLRVERLLQMPWDEEVEEESTLLRSEGAHQTEAGSMSDQSKPCRPGRAFIIQSSDSDSDIAEPPVDVE